MNRTLVAGVRMLSLPEPSASDRVPSWFEPVDQWQCRYCGDGELHLGITTEAEATRVRAHECRCPQRPRHLAPSRDEVDAYTRLFGGAWQQEIEVLDDLIGRAVYELRRSWWPPTRRDIRYRIAAYERKRTRVLAALADLGAGPAIG